jgi:hypothetical protein
MLPVSLDWPSLIVPSVFSNVYLNPVLFVPNMSSVSGLYILECPFGFLLRLFKSCVICAPCCQSLDCQFLIAPSVFYNVYLSPVLFVPNVTSLWIVHSWLSLRFSLTFIFVMWFVSQMLHVSLDCPFLIAPSVFSTFNVQINSWLISVSSCLAQCHVARNPCWQ